MNKTAPKKARKQRPGKAAKQEKDAHAAPPASQTPTEKTWRFYIVAGEASGDRYAALLLSELKKLFPRMTALGVGGSHLRSAGQRQLFDLAVHAVVGLTDVLRHYFKFRDFFYQVAADIEQQKPDALILVDYPGFNLRLARKISSLAPGVPIIYYISPQVWAWKKNRTRLMRRVIDLLLVIFPFEKNWFGENEPDLKVEWVGHPLLDRWEKPAIDENNNQGIHRIAMMPGSRRQEIVRHLPVLLETAAQASVFLRDATFIFLATDEEARASMESAILASPARKLNYEIHTGHQLTHLSRCDLALVASGSATLECCVASVPMLVIYKTNPLTFWIGQKVVQLPYISIVNILAGEKVVPEFLQNNANARRLVGAIRQIAKNPRWRMETRARLREVTARLGDVGASQRAAQAVQKLIQSMTHKMALDSVNV
ncbi:MAG: lipid-A-disaccharide synthase [bacterium]